MPAREVMMTVPYISVVNYDDKGGYDDKHCLALDDNVFKWKKCTSKRRGLCLKDGTVMRIIKLKFFPVPVRLKFRRYFTILCDISDVLHSLEPGKAPIYWASHQAPNCAQHS